MDKNAIKTFAVESRRKMINSVKFQASLLGISADGIADPISKAEGMETYDYGAGQHTIYDEDIKKRESLVREINNKGFENVVEEVAYTWFNRIIAIRYMEVNEYLPTYTRVLSSEIEGKIEPDIITEALDLDLDYSDDDREKILKFKIDNDNDKLFQFLFIKQCNKLNEILPGLFEKTDDYMELLLDIKFTDENSVVRQLVDTISEEDFGEQVEIIGWLYQFYNTELKDETFANLKKKIKITKERIPPATQLFTPDWIVKYMVENSVGRLWIEGHPNEDLKSNWKYYVEESQQDSSVNSSLFDIRQDFADLKLKDIKVIDPCMGSGHVLVYVFDILMQIYISEGFTEKDATISILKNNLFGLDIDDRAYQLAYFAVLMRARKYNKTILNKNIYPLLHPIHESNNISNELINYILSKYPDIKEDLLMVIKLFYDAKEYGSILIVKPLNYEKMINLINKLIENNNDLYALEFKSELKLLKDILNQSRILNEKFDVVVTNPPYMGNRGMSNKLKDYIQRNYEKSKGDLSTVFMEKSFELAKSFGFISMINIPVWMFISSYQELREKMIKTKLFINMLHLGRGIFGSDFGTTSFVLMNSNINNYKSIFKQLYENKGAVESISKKEERFFDENNLFISNQSNFMNIPGNPIVYWVSKHFIDTFNKGISIDDISENTGSQNKTANNVKYLRYFWEVSDKDIGIKSKWVFYAKGGEFRKYYGNLELVVDWSEDARNFYKNNKTSNLLDKKYWFEEGITYTKISSKGTSFRYLPPYCIFDMGGPSLCYLKENLYYLLGLLNSNLIYFYLDLLNPTINIQSKDIRALPIIIDNEYKSKVENLVKENLKIYKLDYDSYETSWSFKKHPLLENDNKLLQNTFDNLVNYRLKLFNIAINNDIQLNKIFLKIYDVTEVDYNINKEDVKLNLFYKDETVESFISYAVGCMFGRYSLDEEGLQFAGGQFNINNYSKFIPDDDNIIPVLDTEYFNDDIVGRFVEFVKVCFGEETLEENLDFIAGALKKKGKTSREIIRNYFLTDFFKDHAQTYKKTPIYWQFDSGKQNAFKCLIYMHRYEPGLVARVRTDYLHKTQKAIEQNLAQCESIIANSSNKSEVSKATKDKSKYIKQLDEIKVYDEALAHIANQRIEIDLDDGVKVNHAKFQNVEISKEGQKAKKINLLKKI